MAVSSSIAYDGPRNPGRPLLCVGHGIVRQVHVIHVRKDREINDSERLVAAGGRPPRRRSPPRCEGSSPCSRRSIPRRPSRAATARARPARTVASNGSSPRHRHRPPAGRRSAGLAERSTPNRCARSARSQPPVPARSRARRASPDPMACCATSTTRWVPLPAQTARSPASSGRSRTSPSNSLEERLEHDATHDRLTGLGAARCSSRS